MKIKFNHSGGIFSNEQCLMEVEAKREGESVKFMFENGWLPFDDTWYQCKSSRLKLGQISSRRKRELSKISFTETGDLIELMNRARKFGCFVEDWVLHFSKEPNYTFFMDDAAAGIVNFFEDQIFYTSLIWDKDKCDHSYGTLSYYHLIDKFWSTHEYMYISEYYLQFKYKQNLPGFQFWRGVEWSNPGEKDFP